MKIKNAGIHMNDIVLILEKEKKSNIQCCHEPKVPYSIEIMNFCKDKWDFGCTK
jgi:hypothetical protein